MIQIRLSHPFPHPQPSLFPPPQQQSKIKRSRQLLFPPKQDEPQDPPQPVAAKSLMILASTSMFDISYGAKIVPVPKEYIKCLK
jgi:hydroxyethylthiazole kinase